jgi:hypothetical protein
MTNLQIKQKLTTATYSVAKVLHQGTDDKVLVIGCNKEIIVKEHKAYLKSKLTVLEGISTYKEANQTAVLKPYEEVEISGKMKCFATDSANSLYILTQQN